MKIIFDLAQCFCILNALDKKGKFLQRKKLKEVFFLYKKKREKYQSHICNKVSTRARNCLIIVIAVRNSYYIEPPIWMRRKIGRDRHHSLPLCYIHPCNSAYYYLYMSLHDALSRVGDAS